MPAQPQPSTNPVKIIVAGLSMGLPSQYAKVAPTEARLLLSATAIGAAQHVHIIDEIDAPPAAAVLRNPLPPNTRANRSRGSRT